MIGNMSIVTESLIMETETFHLETETVYTGIEKVTVDPENMTLINENKTDLDLVLMLLKSTDIDRTPRLVLALTIAVLGTISNGMVLHLTQKHRQFYQPYMYVRAAYAAIDLLTAVMIVPHAFVKMMPFEPWVTCLLTNLATGLFLTTVQLTAYIALERYFYFCRPFHYQRYFGLKSVVIVTVSMLTLTHSYILITEVLIGRKLHPHFILCQLPNEQFHAAIQFVIFFVPAIICTFFSAYKIQSVITKITRDRQSRPATLSTDAEPELRKEAGQKALK